MRSLWIFILVLCCTSFSFAKGIPCEKREYAELKDMDKQTLFITFCYYKRRADSNQEMIQQYQDFSMMKDAEACLDEMIKVGNIFKKSYGEFPPECD